MTLTISDYILLGIILFGGIAFSALIAFGIVNTMNYTKKAVAMTFCIGLVVTAVLVIGLGTYLDWYHTNTASGQRTYKDYKSNIENGIDREILITAEDGREIFHYEGKVDIESNHEDNYIKFESEEGKRYIVYYGITDSILIKEK